MYLFEPNDRLKSCNGIRTLDYQILNFDQCPSKPTRSCALISESLQVDSTAGGICKFENVLLET